MLKKCVVILNMVYFTSVFYGSDNSLSQQHESFELSDNHSEMTPLISPRIKSKYCPAPSEACCTSFAVAGSLCYVTSACGLHGLLASLGCLSCCMLCKDCTTLNDFN